MLCDFHVIDFHLSSLNVKNLRSFLNLIVTLRRIVYLHEFA